MLPGVATAGDEEIDTMGYGVRPGQPGPTSRASTGACRRHLDGSSSLAGCPQIDLRRMTKKEN